MRGLSPSVLLAVFAVAGPLAAQPTLATVPLAVGSRVRVTAPEVVPGRVTGRVISRGEEGLVLSRDRDRVQLSFAPEQVHVLEVSRGRSRLAGGLLGAAAGTFGGAGIGASLGSRNDTNGLGESTGMAAGALVGMVGGAVIGAIAAPERWRRHRFRDP